MKQLDEFLEIEDNFAKQTTDLLQGFHPIALDTIDECASLFDLAANEYGAEDDWSELRIAITKWSEEVGVSPDEAFALMTEGELLSPNTKNSSFDACQSVFRIHSTLHRGLLTLGLRREFFRGMSDFLRNRITPIYGYVRLQCEGVALIDLFSELPHLSLKWLRTLEMGTGEKFYKKNQGRLRKRLTTLKLEDLYNRGCETALHVRPAGLVNGYLMSNRQHTHDQPDKIGLTYQECDHPTLLLSEFCQYLHAQKDILTAIPFAYSDREDSKEYGDSLTQFDANVQILTEAIAPQMKELQAYGIAKYLLTPEGA